MKIFFALRKEHFYYKEEIYIHPELQSTGLQVESEASGFLRLTAGIQQVNQSDSKSKAKMNNIKGNFVKLNHFCYCNGILQATCIPDIRQFVRLSYILSDLVQARH